MPARVLIVEDDVAGMEMLCYLLSSYGYSPLRARNGEEGVKIAAANRPALIICKLQMPLLDGCEVARRIRTDPELNGIALIALSEFAAPGDRSKALAAGFDSYLSKPISPDSFARHMETFLRAKISVFPDAVHRPAIDAFPKTGGRKLLVVDDTPANLKLACTVLEGAGYQVRTARGMLEALRIARKDPPDLILSDVVMADGSGFEFVRAVKADPALRSIPFVFNSSSMAVKSAREKGLAMGAVKYLFRPMQPEDMLREIEACLVVPAGG